MKIKRFVAGTMREALAQVRAEQGPDAVIITNRRIDGGIELITAIDYDESLIEEALKRSRPAPPAPAPALPLAATTPAAAAAPDAEPRAGESLRGRALAALAIGRRTAPAKSKSPDAAPSASTPPAPPAAPALDGRAGRAAKAKAAVERAAFAAQLAGAAVEDDAVDHTQTIVLPAAEAIAALGTAQAPAAPPKRSAKAAPPAAPPPAKPAAAPAASTPRAEVARPVPPAAAARPQVVWSQDPEIVSMRREVEGLRQLLQDQLSSLAWNDRLRREPVRARVLRDLSELGIAPDVARALAERVPAGAAGNEAWRLALALLMKHVPTVDDGLLAQGGTFAVVGPTGVGKTTTIAKLAARYALQHGAREVALVSLDHYRIGARDQLLTFARILGVPMHVAANARELGGVLASLADRRLVLIDTAGMSPRDDRLAAQFATLAVPGARLRTLLAIAANAEHLALDGIARSYAAARPEAILLTKLDEAASFGPALSVAMRHGLPLARLCDGQRVPEDLHAAPAKRVWLVKQAHRLARQGHALAGIDDAYMAERFGKVASHG
jgi:flagellar biosynthesis protein FlhF